MKAFFIVLAILFAQAFGDVCMGDGSGDPVFDGFHGEKFNFQGRRDGIFNLYTDPYTIINSQFEKAKNNTVRGTAMKTIGVVFEGHELYIDSHDNRKTSWEVTFDGVKRTFSDKMNFAEIREDCISIEWKKNKLELTTDLYNLVISYQEFTHDVSVPSLRFSMVLHKPENPHLITGVVGQTAVRGRKLSTESSDFEVSGIFDAPKDSYFKKLSLPCSEDSESAGLHARVSLAECDEYYVSVGSCNGQSAYDGNLDNAEDWICGNAGNYGKCVVAANGDLICSFGTGPCENTCNTDSDCYTSPYLVCAAGANDECPSSKVCIAFIGESQVGKKKAGHNKASSSSGEVLRQVRDAPVRQ